MTATVPSRSTSLGSERRQNLFDVVGSEIIRARSIRSTWWLLVLGIVAGILLTIPGGLDQTDRVTVTTVCLNLGLTTSATAIFAVLSITDEFSLGTLITTVSATPRRSRILNAKLIVASLFGIVVGVVPLVVSLVILTFARTDGLPLDHDGILSCVGVVVSNVLIAIFGVVFGACVRNSTLGVVLVLIIVFLFPLLSFPLGDSGFYLNDYGISTVANFLVSFSPSSLGIDIVALVIWIGVPAVIGSRLFTRREV